MSRGALCTPTTSGTTLSSTLATRDNYRAIALKMWAAAQPALYWLIIAFTSAALVVAAAFFKTSASPTTASDTRSAFFEGRSATDGPQDIVDLAAAPTATLISPLDRDWEKPLAFHIEPKSQI